MKKILLLLLPLILVLPVASFASGHLNGLEYLPVVFALLVGVFVLAMLNVVSFITNSVSSSKKAGSVLLWICLPFNVLIFLAAVRMFIGRYQDHVADAKYGADMEGFHNYSFKAVLIIFLVLAAIVYDVYFIKHNAARERAQQDDTTDVVVKSDMQQSLRVGQGLVVLSLLLIFAQHIGGRNLPGLIAVISGGVGISILLIFKKFIDNCYGLNLALPIGLLVFSEALNGLMGIFWVSWFNFYPLQESIVLLPAIIGYVLLGMHLKKVTDDPTGLLPVLGKVYNYLNPVLYLFTLITLLIPSLRMAFYVNAGGIVPYIMFALFAVSKVLLFLIFGRSAKQGRVV